MRIFPIRTVGQVSRFGVDPVRAMRASQRDARKYRYLGRYLLCSGCREQQAAKIAEKTSKRTAKGTARGARLRNLYLGRVRDDGGRD